MSNLFINDDFGAFALAGFDKMNEAGLKEQIDFYTAAGGVTAILFNRNASRAYFPSKVWDSAWDGATEEDADGRIFFNGQEVKNYTPEPPLYTMVRNFRELAKNVPDVFAVRYAYCHEKGVEMWHSMRINDCHWVPNPEYIQHSRFWTEHPEYRRAAYRRTLSSIWSDQALDFLHPEVREHELALIFEYLEHECDGIELDFLRSVPLFAPGGADAGRSLLTQMMRDIRKAADASAQKFGHRVRIMIRVTPELDETLTLGLDVLTWANEGLFDIVVPSALHPFDSRNDIPVETWRRVMPANIMVVPGIDIGINNGYPDGRLRNDKETDAGFAATCYYRGADGIYLYNHFAFEGTGGYAKREEQKITQSFIGDRAKTEARVRRHVATCRTSTLAGVGARLPFMPTVWKKSGIYNEIDAGGATAGRTGYVLIGSPDAMTQPAIRVNTVLCERVDNLPEGWALPKLKSFAFFRIPDGVLHDGWNGIDVINDGTDADFELRWVELDVL